MSDAPFAGLRTTPRASGGVATPDTQASQTAEPQSQEDTMTNEEHQASLDAARAEAKAEGFANANARYAKVLASEEYTGREKLAAKLLENDSLAADAIIDTLSAAAREGAAAEQTETSDPEAAARDEMKDAIQSQANDDVEANEGGNQSSANAGDLWAKAYEKLGITASAV